MKQLLLLLFTFAFIGISAQVTTIPTVTGSNSGDGEIKLIVAATQTNDDNLQDSVDANALLIAANLANLLVLLDPPHGSMNFADSATVIALTQNEWVKLTGPLGDVFVLHEADGLTMQGDTITISTDGDYEAHMAFSFDGANADSYHVAWYLNGVVTTWEWHRKTSSNDTGNAGIPAHFVGLVAGDDLSIYIRNTGNSNDATLVSGQVIIDIIHPN